MTWVHLRNEFLVIGGTAVQLLGSTRPTEDLDIAASEMAYAVFLQSIESDCFSLDSLTGLVSYTCHDNLQVDIELTRPGFGDLEDFLFLLDLLYKKGDILTIGEDAHNIRETAPLLDKRHQLMLNDILKVCSNSLLESLVTIV